MSQSTPPPQEHTYTLTRDLDASASQVFDAWTAPAQYEQWAGAAPGTVEIDARPGGTWKAVMVTPDGQRIPLTGSYLAVVPDERLVIGMDVPGRSVPATMTLVFEESAGAGTTRVTLSQSCDSAQEREMAEAGSNMLLDSLGSYLAKG